jgi:hypothetical protein
MHSRILKIINLKKIRKSRAKIIQPFRVDWNSSLHKEEYLKKKKK